MYNLLNDKNGEILLSIINTPWVYYSYTCGYILTLRNYPVEFMYGNESRNKVELSVIFIPKKSETELKKQLFSFINSSDNEFISNEDLDMKIYSKKIINLLESQSIPYKCR